MKKITYISVYVAVFLVMALAVFYIQNSTFAGKKTTYVKSSLLKDALKLNYKERQLSMADKKLFKKPVLDLKRVNINVDGITIETATDKDLVIDVLKQKNIALGPKDEINPSLGTKLTDNLSVTIARINEKYFVSNEPVPYNTVNEYTDRMDKGKTAVVRNGQNGVRELLYKIVLRDGKEISRALVSKKVVTQPLSRIVAIGTMKYFTSSRGDVVRYTKVMDMEATAYCNYGYTATGLRAKPGVVAVDPRVIPLGTRLYVEGYGMAVAEDTGGSIVGKRIDLYYTNYNDAVNYGRRYVRVYIVR